MSSAALGTVRIRNYVQRFEFFLIPDYPAKIVVIRSNILVGIMFGVIVNLVAFLASLAKV